MRLYYVEPKLIDGQIVVSIAPEDAAEEINFWETALVEYVVRPSPELAALKAFINKHGSSVPQPQLLCHPSGWYVFPFDTQQGMETILRTERRTMVNC